MKTKLNILIIAIMLLMGKAGMSQTSTTTIKYTYDVNGNRWNRYITFPIGKMAPSDTSGATTASKPHKEILMDSFGLKEIIIFPNPTFDKLNVNVENPYGTPLLGTIKVTNMLGNTEYISQTIQPNNVIDCTSLIAGTYILQLVTNGKVKTYYIQKN